MTIVVQLVEPSGLAGHCQDQPLRRISSRDDSEIRTQEEITRLINDETEAAAADVLVDYVTVENDPSAIGGSDHLVKLLS